MVMESNDPDDLSIEVTAFDVEESNMYSDCDTVTATRTMTKIVPSSTNTVVVVTIPEDSTSIIKNSQQQTYNTSSSNSQYKNMHDQILKWPKEIRNIIAGGLAGMIAKSIVAPFDRIKILYQVSSAEFHIWALPSIAKKIVEREGLKALWKGNTATLIRVFPYSGIQFMVFDRCKTFLLREQEMNYKEAKAINPDTPKPRWVS